VEILAPFAGTEVDADPGAIQVRVRAQAAGRLEGLASGETVITEVGKRPPPAP